MAHTKSSALKMVMNKLPIKNAHAEIRTSLAKCLSRGQPSEAHKHVIQPYFRSSGRKISFLLAIPAILGAMVLGCKDFLTGAAAPVTVEQIIGTVIAAIVGVFALAWLHRWVTQRRLHWFAFWCIPFGILMALLRPWP